MLPSVLFTAAVFEMPPWAEKQLVNLQKQFLWHHSTSTEASRNKMNPGLLYTPKQAGGVGLASVVIATKTQRMQHAIQWLIQRKYIYFAAWKAWAFRGATFNTVNGVSPRQEPTKQGKLTPGNRLQMDLGSWIQPRTKATESTTKEYQQTQEKLVDGATSWDQGKKWFVELPKQLPGPQLKLPQQEEAFWPTYNWNDNPWIRDQHGNMLTTK
ncbi:unnamed protein product [Phytophthora lilii]|uniref:Unnamed protein product n=1 Tax=Phytophthora lilii TaxID=2077276 RepID=A0A9W6X609_9STRA|nr:unnamed protein product [Phytophthora lilii]